MILYSGSMIPGFMRNSAPKEYKCDRRDTGQHPPFVFQTFYSQPLPALLYCTSCPSDRAGERLGESNICKTKGGAVPSINDIYSLSAPLWLRRWRRFSLNPGAASLSHLVVHVCSSAVLLILNILYGSTLTVTLVTPTWCECHGDGLAGICPLDIGHCLLPASQQIKS